MKALRRIGSFAATRRVVLGTGFASTVAALALAGLAMGGTASTTTVQLTSTGPQPATVTVTVGDIVTFANADAQNHSIVSTGFTSPVIQPGETYSQTMNTPGKISYTQTNFGPSKKGQIVVAVNGTVKLTANHPSVVYGESVLLSGTSPLPNRPVTLSVLAGGGHHGGGKAWTSLTTIPTAADGSFSTSVQPTMDSSYRATAFAKVLSQPVTVQVKPRLSIAVAPLKALAGHPVRIVARIVPASAATSLELQQLTGTKHPRTLAQKTVPKNGSVVFIWKVPAGRSLIRIQMPKIKGGASFVTTFSRSISVIGVAPATTAKQPAAPASKTKTKTKTKTGKSTKSHGKHGKHSKH